MKQRAEIKFPVRIRVKVPEGGFGKQYDEIHEWLRERYALHGYVFKSDTMPGQEAVAVYLPDLENLHELVERFGLELVYVADTQLV